MTRTALLPLLFIAALALFSQVHAQTKPECSPLHELYKAWVAPCTQNNTVIPNADSDPAWKPCICKTGFYPLASASENCALDGTSQGNRITPESLDELCKDVSGYATAANQKEQPELSPALATVTSISKSLPTATTTGAVSSPTATQSGAEAAKAFGLGRVVVSLVAMVLATAAAL
ncbi:hypothetical protein BGZ54_007650 [Gamsiella multidivaricata]|nr:hypothetical protein BGZ54_007650 [Gamsiella multidivaricata]